MTDTRMAERTIIGDSGPLIALAIIDQLALLPRLYRRVVVPRAVWEEVTLHGAGLPGAMEVSRVTWLEIDEPSPATLAPLSILVDAGEAQAIALAMTTPHSILLLDDAQARRVAERFGLDRIGTLGILRKAKKAGLLTEIRPLVERLQAGGIYMRQALVDAVLGDVGE